MTYGMPVLGIIHFMKLLFVVDARSPIALNWIRYFVECGNEIYIASTFACSVDFPINKFSEIIPVAFSSVKRSSQRPGGASSRTLSLRTAIRHGSAR